MYKILSIDGGGVRGIIPALWLCELEKQLDQSIYDTFDMFVGTSVGGVIAAGLSSGKSPEQMVDLFRTKSRTIFPSLYWRLLGWPSRAWSEGLSGPKYSDKGLKKVLQEVFGESIFGDLEKPTMVTCFNLHHRRPIVLKSFHPKALTRPLWHVAKITSSAPTFFPAECIDFRGEDVAVIDGAVVANNPSIIGIGEAIKLGVNVEDIAVLSLGTGEIMNPISVEDAKTWGAVEWLPHIFSVMGEGSVDINDYVSRRMLEAGSGSCSASQDGSYSRFQVGLDYSYKDIDNASKSNISQLESMAMSYLSMESDRVERAIQMLKN